MASRARDGEMRVLCLVYPTSSSADRGEWILGKPQGLAHIASRKEQVAEMV